MKPRLLILSDMWGLSHCPWIQHYVDLLDPVFSIQLYDSCALGNVEVVESDEDAVHSAFVHGGIDIAARRLLELEPNEVDILAFSMGGAIAWKAAMTGSHIGHLFAVSSTRLRLQSEKPDCRIHLFYGANDPFQPDASWFEKLKLDPPLIERGGHDFYEDPRTATFICDTIKAGSDKSMPAFNG